MPASSSSVPTEPFSIPESETEQVRLLQKMMQSGDAALVGPTGRRHKIPSDLYGLFLKVLALLERGQAISIVPYMQELTTQQAADLLGVSRQFFVRLLTDGKLTFHMVGTHRRIYLKDLLEFKKERDQKRHKALDEMARRDVEDGTYDRVVLPDE